MGNKAIAERIATAKEVDLVNKFNLEELIDDTLLESLAEVFSTQSKILINQAADQACHKRDFIEFNEQKNEDLEELIKERVIAEINEDITTGFSTPDFFLEELKDPRFEKYFQVKERGEGDEYFKKQYKKFYILYIYYKIKVQDLELTKKDFYESFESYFGEKSTSVEFANFDLSSRSTITIMRELGAENPKLLEVTLNSFYQSFLSTTDEIRRNVGTLDFYAEEELLDELRDFLTEHLLNNSSETIQELCLKLIVLIGNQRGSGEDYLITYNLITKHGFEFNLDPEISQCKFIEIKGQGAKGDEDQLKVSYEGSSFGHILKGEHPPATSLFNQDKNDPNAPDQKKKFHEINFLKPLTLTADNHFAYVYQEDEGLFKYGHSDSVDTKIGYLYKKNPKMDGKNKYFMYLNGNLYCRAPNSDRKPFVLINRETLKEIKNDEDFNTKIETLQKKEAKKEEDKKEDDEDEEGKEEKPKVLEWTKEDKNEEENKGGRFLCESPLFTDGQNIYVISTHREIKVFNREDEDLDEEEDKKDLVIKKWFLEVYDGETWEFKASTELKLDIKVRGLDDIVSEDEEKETDNIKQVRESFSMENITKCSFVTNGKKLLIGEHRRWHIYDLEELKWTFNLNLTSDHWGFDHVTNTFWEVTTTMSLRSFKIPDFKTSENSDESSFKGIIEYINSKVDEIQENQTLKDKIGKSTSKSIAQRLKMKTEIQNKEVNFSSKTKPDYTRFLLMNVLKEGSKELISIAEDINPQAAVGEDKFSIYRGSYSTTVSSTFFSELLQAIENTLPVLVKKEKESANLLEQYNLYMLFILLKTSMMCLSKLNLSLSTVVAQKSDYDRFLKIIQDHISDIVSREKLEYTYEEGKYNAELETLWGAIQNECRAIMAFSLSLVYESLGDLMRKVSSSLDKLEAGEVDNSLGIYIRYLTLPETMNKALNDVDIKDMILVVYEKLCDKKTRKLVSAIESVKYETHELKRLTYNSLEKNSEGFIYSVTQNIINKYFQANKELEAEEEKDKPDKDKVEKLGRKVELKAIDLIKVLEIISESTLQIIQVCTSSSQIYLNAALKQQRADEEIKHEEDRPHNSGFEKYCEFHRYLYNIAKENNNFTNLMHVYVAAFSSLQDSAHVKTLSLLSVKILRVIETFSKFKDVKNEDMKLKESQDLLRSYLDNDVIKFFVWTISKMSYSFISVQKEMDLSEEEKMNKAILDSKLLSGGMENRFLGTLTKDTSSQLRDMCEVTGDKVIKGYLTKEPERIDDDDLFLSIIHQGKDENVDRIVGVLQYNLERKHIWGKVGKEEGLRLCRAAFANMIKISGLSTDFFMLMDEIEMRLDSVQVADENATQKELAREIIEIDSYNDIFKRYESAAKMRSWYQEKKKSWAEKIRKEEEEKKRKEEEEKRKKEKEAKDKKKGKEETKEEIKEEEEDEEEVIETSTSPDGSKKTKDQVELAKIVDKVVEKAEFMLKLVIPIEWGNSEAEGALIQNMSEREERDKEEQDIEEKGDWMTKLKTWKSRQSEHLGSEKNTAVYSSSISSIMACLQAPITAQRIKKQIESIYVNAMKRICGFRLIARLSYVNHPIDTCIEYLNWFCSSLRHNTNVLSHYTDGVSGCGEHLQNELKKSFFLVFNGIVKQLKKTKSKEDIKFLLNCCKWQFTASDHDSIIRSEIFEVLSEGNGEIEEKENPIKYCWGHKFRYKEASNYPLCQDVLDLFEQVLVACFARIIRGDSGEEQKLKSTGTSVPKIERAHSKLNTSTTESLIANGFKHVFEQLQKYIEFTQEFEGIDWEFYVSKRNNQRLKGEKMEESDSEEDDVVLEEGDAGFIGPAMPPGMYGGGGGSLFGASAAGGLFGSSSRAASTAGLFGGTSPGISSLLRAAPLTTAVEETKTFVAGSTRRDYDEGEGEGDHEDDALEEEEEDIKDKVQQKVEDKENKEIKKIKELYEDKYIIRFLKLIEIFSSIATNQTKILGMVLKVATPEELTILLNLLVHSAPRHGFTIIKILDNLIRVGIPHEMFDESIKRLAKDPESVHSRIMNQISPINKFEKTPFLKFLYNYVISIRSSMWTDSSFDSNGSFILSNKMLSIFRTILNNDTYKFYKTEITLAIDHLIAHSDDYDLEELEPLLSILNGGEYLGLGLGTHGVSSDGSMFTVLGFVKKWYGIKNPGEENNPNNQNVNLNSNDDLEQKHKLNYYLQDKADYVLALYYDPKHPERTDIFTTIPEEVKLTPNIIKETNDILLDKERLNLFLKNFKLDQELDKRDYKKTTVRTLALKILEQYISDHGEGIIKLIDEEFYKAFLKILYSEACAPSTDKSAQQNDWIEQRVHALQEFAIENKGSLRTSSDTKIRFTNKNLVLTKTLKSAGNQKYSKCIDLISAMNYGRVILGENYLVHQAAKLPKEDKNLSKIQVEDLRLIDSSQLTCADDLYRHLKTTKIILSCDVNVEEMHQDLLDKDSDLAYFRSVVLIGKSDYDNLKEFLEHDPEINVVNTTGLSSEEKFIREMTEYGGFEEKTLREILKDNPDATLSQRTNLVADWFKDQEEKKDSKEEDKKDEFDDYSE